jgi:hypothetical protein
VSWAGKPASASTLTSLLTTRTRRREQARSSSQRRHCSGPCPNPRCQRHATCTARRRPSLSRRPCNRPRARSPAYTISPARGTTKAHMTKMRPFTWAAPWGSQQTRAGCRLGRGSLTCADKPRTVTPATS